MALDLSNPGAVRAEAERRQRARAAGVPLSADAATAGSVSAKQNVAGRRPRVVRIGDPPVAERDGDRLMLALPFPPRTKKNSKQNYGTQSVAYRRFVHQVRGWVEPFRAELALPLPDQWYNCAAQFHVDNDAADTVGLMQGLADALQDAGVLTNDRWIRTWNGTDQCTAKERPRVVLTLTPIEEP